MLYRERINDNRKVYLNGELIKDVSKHSAFEGAIHCVEQYYSLQNEKPEEHSFIDEDGQQCSISLLVPKNIEDLERKRKAYKEIADISYGMLGRTPDFINAAVATISAHASFFGSGEYANYTGNAKQYYKHVKKNNLFIAHGSINPQIDRSKALGGQEHDFAGVHVVRYDASGIVVKGAKMIVTLAPIADELLIFNMPGLKTGDENYAVAFTLPVNSPGLKVICRKPLVKEGYDKFDHPLTNQFDEIDAYLLLDEVFVPWDRVLIFRDVEKSNQFYDKTFARHHTGHQGIVRGLAKAELLTGIAIKLAEMLKLNQFINVQEKLGELTSYVELLKASIVLSEQDAYMSPEGVITPSINAIQAIRYNFPKMYEKMVKCIQSLAAGSMLATPHHEDFFNENGDYLMMALSTGEFDAKERTMLLNLAWDASGDAFGQRQLVYEYYHAGDPMRIAAGHYLSYEKGQMYNMVERILKSETNKVCMSR
ncbi:4-hydroxyphenylacetate 3-monooxygenase [Bacillus anthracis]|nr:4-hydroxyphenylacetate 3-monooxygenase [Bacillus anthracis]